MKNHARGPARQTRRAEELDASLSTRPKSGQATRLSAWFLTSDLLPRRLISSGHAVERVVPDFPPDRRLKVNDHDLKLVACQGKAVACRSKVNDHDLKLVACERLFGYAPMVIVALGVNLNAPLRFLASQLTLW